MNGIGKPVMSDNRIYFANLPRSEIAAELYTRVTDYYDEVARNGQLALWDTCYRYYFATDEKGRHEASGIAEGGEQGELAILKANHYRNLLQHLLVLTTQQRPIFDCRAINTDYKSQVQTILGKNILEYYMREQRLDQVFRQAAELAIVYSEAYIEVDWDKMAGEDKAVDPETGELVRSGDVVVRCYEPRDVIRRCAGKAGKRQPWYILRDYENRYDLAAQHPELAEAILDHSDDGGNMGRIYDLTRLGGKEEKDDELVPVYKLYHDKSAACPLGRYVKFLGPDLVLEYEVLDDEMPVYPMIPQKRHGTGFGYSVSFDLICVQEAVDIIYSTVLSNQTAFGVQNIWMKPGSNVMPTQLAGGLNVIESNEKPESINLTNTPQEIFKFLQGLEQLGEVLSGVNSVARGQPEASLKSGSALALVASQAVQFSNGLQAAYTNLLEDVGTSVLRKLQRHATIPRTAMIAGKNNRSYVKEFSSTDIADIGRVMVDIGNPVSRTVAGRIQMAQDLLQNGQFTKPEQYISVMETGSLDPAIEETRNEELLLESENEALREGTEVVQAVFPDNHLKHINSHKFVLAGPEERKDPALVERVMAHIQEHVDLLMNTNPALLNALGQQSIAPQMPQGPQGANAQQPNAEPQQPGTGAPGEQVQAPAGTAPDVAAQMPSMPQDPSAQIPGGTPAA